MKILYGDSKNKRLPEYYETQVWLIGNNGNSKLLLTVDNDDKLERGKNGYAMEAAKRFAEKDYKDFYGVSPTFVEDLPKELEKIKALRIAGKYKDEN
jgi:hypothetical protein